LFDLQTCKQTCGRTVENTEASCLEKQKAAWNCQNAQADASDFSAYQTELDAALACLS
jgi:hypothetical protein